MQKLWHLQVLNPKDDEIPIDSVVQIFSSLFSSNYLPWWRYLFTTPKTYSFEIYLLSQRIYFYVSTPASDLTLIQSLLTSSYPNVFLKRTTDPLDFVLKAKNFSTGELVLAESFYLPIRTYVQFKNVDPLSALIGYLSKQKGDLRVAIQYLLAPLSFPWQNKAFERANSQVEDEASGRFVRHPKKAIISQKASFPGGKVLIRLAVSSDTMTSLTSYLKSLADTFGVFSLGEGNRFVLKFSSFLGREKLIRSIKQRSTSFWEGSHQVLNAQEMASIWHPPGKALAGIKNIAWGKSLAGEPPDDLPVISPGLSEEEKREINFFAKTEFRNQERIFGIKTEDRRKHIYIIGKTGAGKSTLIANMAIDDIRKGRGLGIIDPHGDLSETILDYIPKRRVKDVVYLEPFDTSRPFSLNVLEVKNKEQEDLVASGIVSIFYKLYKNSWGPRLEYILRNVILTLLDVPGSTLVDVLFLLANKKFRDRIVSKLKDPVLKNFWQKEFERMPDRLRSEAISPIQNKVGQFVTSRMIRPIIGLPSSTINLEKIMNGGKILILNLSQGKLGEDNAALLGAMFITQIQLAAMNRAFVKEEERKDFFLYVDEFQNFATSSFIKILSEARKYRLSLTLANQYIDQLDEGVVKAILGNVGTLIAFIIGSRDAQILTKEFSGVYSENDLVSLGKYEIVLKLSINGRTSPPFPAKTLPLPTLKNNQKEKIIRLSKERYGRKAKAS